MAHKPLNLGAAIMQPGRQASAAGNVVALGETPMILTLDQLRPNPDNPRTTRNPRYDDIKNSIHARGLDTVPKVTRMPDSEPDVYIFSDGGNTRYQILTELWKETGDPRFYRIHVLFKPWPGRLQCVIGHLAENEVRGELTFIEKAQGIHKARLIYEEQLNKSVSMRELSSLLTEQGLPVDASSISRMENALKYLYPWIPELMESGLGRHQVTALLALRQDAERVWGQFALASGTDAEFDRVFGESCRKFNSPELWSLEMFRDELIGDLLQALPHPSLDYDRWLLELDPKERNRRHHFGEPEPVVVPPSVRDSGTGQSGTPVSRIRLDINHENLLRMLQQARTEQKRLQRIDRALALGGSIELMAFYFGLSSVDVAARRRIAGIDVRPGRGVTLSDEESAELWRLWQKAGITDVESADGLDVMMLAAEQMNIPLTAIWHAVRGWCADRQTEPVRNAS